MALACPPTNHNETRRRGRDLTFSLSSRDLVVECEGETGAAANLLRPLLGVAESLVGIGQMAGVGVRGAELSARCPHHSVLLAARVSQVIDQRLKSNQNYTENLPSKVKAAPTYDRGKK